MKKFFFFYFFFLITLNIFISGLFNIQLLTINLPRQFTMLFYNILIETVVDLSLGILRVLMYPVSLPCSFN